MNDAGASTSSTAAELADVVARILSRGGRRIEGERVAVRRSEHSSSCALYEIDVDAHGVPPLMLKDLSPHAQTPEATGIRPEHLYSPLRELAVYRRLLAPGSIGVRFFGGCIDRRRGRTLILIERVEAMALDYVGDFETWRRAARWIGALHARFRASGIPARLRRHLIEVDRAGMGFWLERAARTSAGGRLAPIVAARRELCDEFARLPRTFSHGELYASNILVDDDHVYPVDWELASFAPGVIDIAALTAGAWSSEEKALLVEAYRDGAGDAGEASDRAIDLARLYLALRLIGWAEHWIPPADEQYDWIAEATGAFDRLKS